MCEPKIENNEEINIYEKDPACRPINYIQININGVASHRETSTRLPRHNKQFRQRKGNQL